MATTTATKKPKMTGAILSVEQYAALRNLLEALEERHLVECDCGQCDAKMDADADGWTPCVPYAGEGLAILDDAVRELRRFAVPDPNARYAPSHPAYVRESSRR
jgi:hypothetical protein